MIRNLLCWCCEW